MGKTFDVVFGLVLLFTADTTVSKIWCPGDKVEYSCTTSTRLVWSGTVFTGQCSEERIFISDNETLECGQMTATNIIAPDPNFPQYTIIRSTLAFIVRPEMMGATIMCITPLRVTLDATLNIRNITPSLFISDSSSNGIDSKNHEIIWYLGDEALPCNLTFSLNITRASQPGATMLIPRVNSGHNVSLTPGIYTVTIESVSGTEQVSSNLEHVIVMNRPLAPYVTASMEGECFTYRATILWKPYTNETTSLTLSYILTIQDKALAVNGQEVVLNSVSSVLVETDSPDLKLGRLNCFTVKATSSLGIGESSNSCIENRIVVPAAIVRVDLETTENSVLFRYTPSSNCVADGHYFIATELTYPFRQMTNKSVISGSLVLDLISNLMPGKEYYYCTILSDESGGLLKICGTDLMGGGRFRTDKPSPPAEINGAILFSETPVSVIYKCHGELERFSDGNVTLPAEFDENTQSYTLNGTCIRQNCTQAIPESISESIPEFVSTTVSLVIVSALGFLVLGAFIGILATYYIMRKKALKQQLHQQSDGIYDVVTNLGAINRTFEMEDNAAYGPIRKYSMEENRAYVPARSIL